MIDRSVMVLGVVGAVILVVTARADEAAWRIEPERLKDQADENWPIALDTTGLVIRPDVVFASPGGEDVTLDLYAPADRDGEPLPCVAAIHGGAWRVNTKEWFAPHAVYLARAGYVTVTINYRKLPKHPVAACVEDAKAAIRWVRENADELKIDPKRVGALGGSAGGHLAAVLATTDDAAAKVDAAVGFAAGDLGHPGLANFLKELNLTPEQATNLGAFDKIDATSAPLLLVHGTDDDAVPCQVSEDLHERYQRRGAESELVMLSGYHHVFYVTPRTFFEAMDYATDFFDKQLRRGSE